jgi:xanthine/uracil/vitamin C permease (AzgA family)
MLSISCTVCPPIHIVIGTAVSSGVASIIAGAMGNLPLGLSPGVGLSAYLAYGLVLSEVLTIGQAFTAVSRASGRYKCFTDA